MIGIIGAMDIEVDILKQSVSSPVTTTVSGINFVSGRLFDHDVVIAKCGIGKVFAAMCTEAMMINFKPELIINTGVAGSLSDKLHTMDVAIARAVVHHDFDASDIGDEKGRVSGLDSIEIPSDPAISLALEGIIKGFGINCVHGVIASGDQFISDRDKKEEIKNEFSAVACDMEGASIGQVCLVNKIPFTIIRSISDSADDNSGMDYATFAAAAARQSAKIVENFIMSL
ncbi:MAG: 5'-methylthioadenosine/adenosylhomocysteine nucleosidase [Clostridia bacterium]|nr:5'-methylthioadenosine/adenosylhomocysteine nucleosidase [Clostridia bacterium]